MSEHESDAAGTPVPVSARTRLGLIDLVAFLGVLAFVASLVLLVDRSGQISERLAFAGAAGVAAACVTAWRRLRRPEPRRWRSGQVAYRGRRITLVSAWGVEGQPLPPLESLDAEKNKQPDPTAPQ